MELFGGLMVMMSILFFFLSVVWFALPFVIFSMKGKVDRAIDLLESIERRLTLLEAGRAVPPPAPSVPPPGGAPPSESAPPNDEE